MHCAHCGFNNPPTTKFCGACGNQLARICPNCGFNNPADFRFCGECGISLGSAGSESTARATVRPQRHDAERRQLTVMFCDMVGSTELTERLDPEDFRDVLTEYQTTCRMVVERYEGHVAQYLGDGILVYFGYPGAHEDDAVRCVRSALEIIKKIDIVALRLKRELDVELAVRIGIDSGLVVVGEIGEGESIEQLALGETLNVAARLQSLAEPGSVLITAPTRRLVHGFFEGFALDPVQLKGISTPVEIYNVTRPSRARNRVDAEAFSGLSPLVGREPELTQLRNLWKQTLQGRGEVVELVGEPGIGKSRLVAAIRQKIAREPHLRIDLRCSPYYRNTPLHPVIEMLERLADFGRDDGIDKRIRRLARLERTLARFGLDAAEHMPLIASLLTIPLEAGDNQPAWGTQGRQKITAALLETLGTLAREHHILLVVEDLHWADPSTLELVDLLVEEISKFRIFTLLTFRPTFDSPWNDRSDVTTITLGRLERSRVEMIIERLTGGRNLPTEILEHIVNRTDGIPLFVEELTKMVLESGLLQERDGVLYTTGPLPPLAIPATLHDSLMARLDRLAALKDIAQLGATIGREFSYRILSAVATIDDETLRHGLECLVESEILFATGTPPDAIYTFKHALIQEAAYESLLRSRRSIHHQKIAQTLEERFPETAKSRPELLAYHYTGAGLVSEAIGWWQQAGEQALRRSAHLEAIDHFTRGLSLLTSLAANEERDRRELEMTIPYGVALMAHRGFGSIEASRTYNRAYELCRRINDTEHLTPVMVGLAISSFLRGEMAHARTLGEEMLRLAEEGNHRFALASRMILGVVSTYMGELRTALTHLDTGLTFYDESSYADYIQAYGQDPLVVMQSYRATTLMILGYPEQALEQSREALDRARGTAHSFTLAIALNFRGWILQLCDDPEELYEISNELITISVNQRFAFWHAWGVMMLGLTLLRMGNIEEGTLRTQEGFDLFDGTAARMGEAQILGYLATAYGCAGRFSEALQLLENTLADNAHYGSMLATAELLHVKGMLLLSVPTPDRSGAEECFRRAMEIGVQHDAKLVELRNAVAIARLLRGQGDERKGYDILEPVYAWYTEGFHLPLLREASSLLEEISSESL